MAIAVLVGQVYFIVDYALVIVSLRLGNSSALLQRL